MGREDREVAAIVASVDARRVAYIAKLLAAAGVEGQRRTSGGLPLLGLFRPPMVMDPRHASMAAAALDDIGELFEK